MNYQEKIKEKIMLEEAIKNNQRFGQEKSFVVTRVLGKGTYGEVYECYDLKLKIKVAIKKLIIRSSRRQGIPATTIREIGILMALKHENIVGLKMIDQDEDGIYLIFEMMDTDLAWMIKKRSELFKPVAIKYILFQILNGVNFMHSKRIFHRDLKPANILLSRDGEHIKIADFGLSRTIHQPFRPYSPEILTIWYKAPEMCLGKKIDDYSIGVDVWSIGCIFAEMVFGVSFFKGEQPLEMLCQYFEVFGYPSKENWPDALKIFPKVNWKSLRECKYVMRVRQLLKEKTFEELVGERIGEQGVDLLRLMLKLDPMKRICCGEAMKHTFFDEIRA